MLSWLYFIRRRYLPNIRHQASSIFSHVLLLSVMSLNPFTFRENETARFFKHRPWLVLFCKTYLQHNKIGENKKGHLVIRGLTRNCQVSKLPRDRMSEWPDPRVKLPSDRGPTSGACEGRASCSSSRTCRRCRTEPGGAACRSSPRRKPADTSSQTSSAREAGG